MVQVFFHQQYGTPSKLTFPKSIATRKCIHGVSSCYLYLFWGPVWSIIRRDSYINRLLTPINGPHKSLIIGSYKWIPMGVTYHTPTTSHPPNDPPAPVSGTNLPSPAKEQIRSLPRYSLSAPSKAIQPNLRRHGAGFYLAKMMRFGNDGVSLDRFFSWWFCWLVVVVMFFLRLIQHLRI